jgi:hypothetical protein
VLLGGRGFLLVFPLLGLLNGGCESMPGRGGEAGMIIGFPG